MNMTLLYRVTALLFLLTYLVAAESNENPKNLCTTFKCGILPGTKVVIAGCFGIPFIISLFFWRKVMKSVRWKFNRLSYEYPGEKCKTFGLYLIGISPFIFATLFAVVTFILIAPYYFENKMALLTAASVFVFCILIVLLMWGYNHWKYERYRFTSTAQLCIAISILMGFSLQLFLTFVTKQNEFESYSIYISYNICLWVIVAYAQNVSGAPLDFPTFLKLDTENKLIDVNNKHIFQLKNRITTFLYLGSVAILIGFGALGRGLFDDPGLGWRVCFSLMYTDIAIFFISKSESRPGPTTIISYCLFSRWVMFLGLTPDRFFVCFSVVFFVTSCELTYEAIKYKIPLKDKEEILDTALRTILKKGGRKSKKKDFFTNPVVGTVIYVFMYLAYMVEEYVRYQLSGKRTVETTAIDTFLDSGYLSGLGALIGLFALNSNIYSFRYYQSCNERLTWITFLMFAFSIIFTSVCTYIYFQILEVNFLSLLGLTIPATATISVFVYNAWRKNGYNWTDWLLKRTAEYDQEIDLRLREKQVENMIRKNMIQDDMQINKGQFWNSAQQQVQERAPKRKPLGKRPSWKQFHVVKLFLYDLIRFRLSYRDYISFICIGLIVLLICAIPGMIEKDLRHIHERLAFVIAELIGLLIASIFFLMRFFHTLEISQLNAFQIFVFLTHSCVELWLATGVYFYPAILFFGHLSFSILSITLYSWKLNHFVVIPAHRYGLFSSVFLGYSLIISGAISEERYFFGTYLFIGYSIFVFYLYVGYKWATNGFYVPESTKKAMYFVTCIIIIVVGGSLLAVRAHWYAMLTLFSFLICIVLLARAVSGMSETENSKLLTSHYIFPVFRCETGALGQFNMTEDNKGFVSLFILGIGLCCWGFVGGLLLVSLSWFAWMVFGCGLIVCIWTTSHGLTVPINALWRDWDIIKEHPDIFNEIRKRAQMMSILEDSENQGTNITNTQVSSLDEDIHRILSTSMKYPDENIASRTRGLSESLRRDTSDSLKRNGSSSLKITIHDDVNDNNNMNNNTNKGIVRPSLTLKTQPDPNDIEMNIIENDEAYDHFEQKEEKDDNNENDDDHNKRKSLDLLIRTVTPMIRNKKHTGFHFANPEGDNDNNNNNNEIYHNEYDVKVDLTAQNDDDTLWKHPQLEDTVGLYDRAVAFWGWESQSHFSQLLASRDYVLSLNIPIKEKKEQLLWWDDLARSTFKRQSYILVLFQYFMSVKAEELRAKSRSFLSKVFDVSNLTNKEIEVWARNQKDSIAESVTSYLKEEDERHKEDERRQQIQKQAAFEREKERLKREEMRPPVVEFDENEFISSLNSSLLVDSWGYRVHKAAGCLNALQIEGESFHHVKTKANSLRMRVWEIIENAKDELDNKNIMFADDQFIRPTSLDILNETGHDANVSLLNFNEEEDNDSFVLSDLFKRISHVKSYVVIMSVDYAGKNSFIKNLNFGVGMTPAYTIDGYPYFSIDVGKLRFISLNYSPNVEKDSGIELFLKSCACFVWLVPAVESHIMKANSGFRALCKTIDYDVPTLVVATGSNYDFALDSENVSKLMKTSRRRRKIQVHSVYYLSANSSSSSSNNSNNNNDNDNDDNESILLTMEQYLLDDNNNTNNNIEFEQISSFIELSGIKECVHWIVTEIYNKSSIIRKDGGLLWRQPRQFLDNPHLIIRNNPRDNNDDENKQQDDNNDTSLSLGIDSREVVQGNLETCYLLAAVSVCARVPGLLERLFIAEDLYGEASVNNGIFGMMFYVHGKWRAVFIDDQFPTTEDGKFVFSHCLDSNELWVPVLEKCYAKLYGGYQNIIGGLVNEAFQDLTGGVTSVLNLRDKHVSQNDLWQKLLLYENEGYLLGCGNPLPPGSSQKLVINCGIISGHAYSLLDIQEVEGHKLLNLRNPWGDTEWDGDWSDHSDRWTPKLKQILHVKADSDGEFWISFNDFCNYFQTVYICRIFKDVVDKSILTDTESQMEQYTRLSSMGLRPWYREKKESSWSIKKRTAQGAPSVHNKNKGSQFEYNPQYQIRISGTKPAVVFITLRQGPLEKDEKKQSRHVNQFIAVDIINNNGKIISSPLKTKDYFVSAQVHTNQREVNQEVLLLHDTTYNIYPSTLENNMEASFVLSAYSRVDISMTKIAS